MKTKNQNTIELEKDLISLIRIYDPILYTRFNNLENKQREIIFRYLLTQFHQNVSVYFDERIDKSHFSFYQRIYNGQIKIISIPYTKILHLLHEDITLNKLKEYIKEKIDNDNNDDPTNCYID